MLVAAFKWLGSRCRVLLGCEELLARQTSAREELHLAVSSQRLSRRGMCHFTVSPVGHKRQGCGETADGFASSTRLAAGCGGLGGAVQVASHA